MIPRPSNTRLLAGIDHVLDTLIPTVPNPTHVGTLETMRAVVGELLTRRNDDHRGRILAEGTRLIERASALLDMGDAEAARFAAGASLVLDAGSTDLGLFGYLLTLATRLLGAAGGPEATSLLDDIIAWEVLLWAIEKPTLPASADVPQAPRLERDAVERSLRRHWRDTKILEYDEVSGGYSKTTIMIATDNGSTTPDRLVLRAEQPVTPFLVEGSDIVREYHALRAIHATGLPVAEPIMIEADPTAAGSRFLISRQLAGGSCGNFLGGTLADPQKTIADLAAVLARIHRMPIDRASPDIAQSHLARWAAHDTIAAATRSYVAYWRDMANRSGCGTSPAVQRAFDWLEHNIPESEGPPVLVHGDYGLHNVLIENDLVSGVIDWESSACCDPAEDFPTFFGATRQYADEATVYRLYRESGGHEISPFRLHYFSVLACMKAIILGQASLEVIDRHPHADLKFSFISYRYVHPTLMHLNDAIRAAEALRNPQDQRG